MQVSTGNLYPTLQDAFAAGVPRDDLVEIIGTRMQAEAISTAVRQHRAYDAKVKARRATQKSRRANRGR